MKHFLLTLLIVSAPLFIQCRSNAHYVNGTNALNNYYQNLDPSQMRIAFEEYKKVKDHSYQKQISSILLSCYLVYGEYENGKQYFETLTEKDYEYQEVSLLYPDIFDAGIAAVQDNAVLFNTHIWRIINNSLNYYEKSGSFMSLSIITMIVSMCAPDSPFMNSLNDCLMSGNYEHLSSIITDYNQFEFQPSVFLLSLSEMVLV